MQGLDVIYVVLHEGFVDFVTLVRKVIEEEQKTEQHVKGNVVNKNHFEANKVENYFEQFENEL